VHSCVYWTRPAKCLLQLHHELHLAWHTKTGKTGTLAHAHKHSSTHTHTHTCTYAHKHYSTHTHTRTRTHALWIECVTPMHSGFRDPGPHVRARARVRTHAPTHASIHRASRSLPSSTRTPQAPLWAACCPPAPRVRNRDMVVYVYIVTYIIPIYGYIYI
jgi:hypothetical protein